MVISNKWRVVNMKKDVIDHYTVDAENPESWDEYFYRFCVTAAGNSKCLSRKIGAVIVRDKTILSTGYNGPPRGIMTCDKRWLHDIEIRKEFNKRVTEKGRSDLVISETSFLVQGKLNEGRWKTEFKGICPRYVKDMGYKSGQGLEWCVAGHAERNAIVNAARMGMPELKECTIFMSCGVPCTPCWIEIINAGIVEIVCTEIAFYDFDRSSKYLLENSDLKIRKFDFIEE
jgi:dCMP deaminase